MPNESSSSETRRALISGGGSGIGRATALAFASRGYDVALLGRRRDPLLETARRCGEKGAEAEVLVADVGQEDQIEAAISALDARWQHLDVLVNNAGMAGFGTIESIGVELWEEVLRVNLTGPFLLSRRLLPKLRRGRHPAIVHVASTLGLVGLKGAAAYCAAKGGLVNLTRAMALDHAGEGIRVNAVCPAVVDTAMLEADRGEGPQKRYKEQLVHLHPLGRIATAEEVAEVIVFLASPTAAFVTGAVMTVDGGQLAGFSE